MFISITIITQLEARFNHHRLQNYFISGEKCFSIDIYYDIFGERLEKSEEEAKNDNNESCFEGL